MDVNLLNLVNQYGPGVVGGAVSSGLLKGPIQSIQDIWDIAIGNRLSCLNEKNKKKLQEELLDLGEKTAKETSQISEENIQEPKMNILGPALEACKYHIEDEELRAMFAKLIASSIDSSKNNISHPSFVEIIKQMNKIDAEILTIIKSTETKNIMICNIKRVRENSSFTTLIKNLTVELNLPYSLDLISSSLTNLERLGIVQNTYLSHRSGTDSYDLFEKTQIYQQIKNEFDKFNLLPETKRVDPNGTIATFEIELEKGLSEITPFGENFCKICLD